jgi:hypothetical protein
VGANSAPPIPLQAQSVEHAWEVIRSHGTRLTFIFTEGEPLLRELEKQRHVPFEDNPFIRCMRISNAGHTFRPQWAQQQVHQLIDRELEMSLELSAHGNTQDRTSYSAAPCASY